jgi:hypothetical protein
METNAHLQAKTQRRSTRAHHRDSFQRSRFKVTHAHEEVINDRLCFHSGSLSCCIERDLVAVVGAVEMWTACLRRRGRAIAELERSSDPARHSGLGRDCVLPFRGAGVRCPRVQNIGTSAQSVHSPWLIATHTPRRSTSVPTVPTTSARGTVEGDTPAIRTRARQRQERPSRRDGPALCRGRQG